MFETNASSDTNAELEAIRVAALEAGADAAVPSWHWGEGGKGALELAHAVVDTCNSDKQSFRYLYDLHTSITEKIEIIAKEIYGADGIELSEEAQHKVDLYKKQVRCFQDVTDFRDSVNCLCALQRLNIRSLPIPMLRVFQLDSKFLFET